MGRCCCNHVFPQGLESRSLSVPVNRTRNMKPRAGLLLGFVASTACNGSVAFLQQQSRWRIQRESAGLFKSSSSTTTTTTVAISARKVMGQRVHINSWDDRERGGVERLRGSAADASSAPLNKKGKDGRASVKKAVELWSENSLELHRFHLKRVHVCNAETLPEILIEFWKITAECAQAKFAAMEDDRDYAAHVLFVVPWCDLLKDYGMMRHLDKVLDFCSGGCRDFGRTVTLQHYHPMFALPRSQGNSDDRHSNDLARVVNFSRSPYPAFGLTVAGGSAARSDPLSQGDKIGRLRLDLEMVYNSVAGCSTDDNVDAHGSEHGTIPSSPKEVEEKTLRWLKSFSERPKGEQQPGWMRVLDGVGDGDVVTSGLSTPEEVLSQIWSIVSQLQAEVKPILSAEEGSHSVAIHGGGVEEGDNDRDPLASTLLVAPRLHPFNSAQFEHFASNLAIALKQTPIIDRFEVEVYHPEYVCDPGVVDPDRRSPFPTLLIKHCGLKDELFEPSGLHRHTVPPLELPPVEAVSPSEDGTDESSPPSSPEDSRPGVPTDDTEI